MAGKAIAPRLVGLPRATVLSREVAVAVGLRARLLGLAHLEREEAGGGLLIPRCSSVHTFGMRFALDLVFLDGNGVALSFRPGIGPRRMVAHRRAAAVLELPSPQGENSPGWLIRGAMLPHREEIASVVVCEDDTATLELLCDNLAADRFGVMPAPSASDALRLCRYNHPDLLLLDLALPDASGLDVLREIRQSDGVDARFDPRLPVIVLTGRGTDAERVRGLESGADDYLLKPVHYPELLARITAVLRRCVDRRSGPRRAGEIAIDPARREVKVGERGVRLSNKEFALLQVLASDPTRVFSKDELLDEVWGYRTVGRTRTLDSHASRLRRKLDPEHSRYVVNCWGVGYRLVDG
jgi:DNA-binding response OmpR family regulator